MPLASFDCQRTFYNQSPPNPKLITFTGTKTFSFLIPGYLHNSIPTEAYSESAIVHKISETNSRFHMK